MNFTFFQKKFWNFFLNCQKRHFLLGWYEKKWLQVSPLHIFIINVSLMSCARECTTKSVSWVPRIYVGIWTGANPTLSIFISPRQRCRQHQTRKQQQRRRRRVGRLHFGWTASKEERVPVDFDLRNRETALTNPGSSTWKPPRNLTRADKCSRAVYRLVSAKGR